MMLGNKLNGILTSFVLVFVTLPSLEAKIFWFNYYPVFNQYPVNSVPENERIFVTKEQERVNLRDLIAEVITLVNKRHRLNNFEDETVENKCARVFGSIYGTKQQRLMCLKNLKQKREMKYRQKAALLKDLNNKNPFTDFTRAVVNSNSKMRTDKMYKPQFSTDYIDFGDLRTNGMQNNYRKSIQRKEKDLIKPQRFLDTSDSDSNGLIELQRANENYYKKPKRFQVIDNSLSEDSTDSSDDSDDNSSDEEHKTLLKPNKNELNVKTDHFIQDSDEDDSSEVKYKKPVKNNKKELNVKRDYSDSDESSESKEKKSVKTNIKKVHYIQGRDDFSEEYSEPAKIKKNILNTNKKKEYYLQGVRLVSPSSDEDGRKRLKSFLPKRFHWEEEDIHNLGYFWFNGPQGRYPYFPIRP